MTTVLDPPKVEEVLTDGVLLHNISWETYESLLRDNPDAASPRLTYDRGDLLIMVTSPEHEEINATIKLLIELLAHEFRIESRAFGSTENSLVLPKVTAVAITRFIHEGLKPGRLEWVEKVRTWAQ